MEHTYVVEIKSNAIINDRALKFDFNEDKENELSFKKWLSLKISQGIYKKVKKSVTWASKMRVIDVE